MSFPTKLCPTILDIDGNSYEPYQRYPQRETLAHVICAFELMVLNFASSLRASYVRQRKVSQGVLHIRPGGAGRTTDTMEPKGAPKEKDPTNQEP